MYNELLNKKVIIKYLSNNDNIISRKGVVLGINNNTIRLIDSNYRNYWIDKNKIKGCAIGII